MGKQKILSLNQLISENWTNSRAWPDFIEAMLLVLPAHEGLQELDRDPNRWALLPQLCCQAAGGDPKITDEISAAWLMLYIAAHLVDSVEDEDPAEEINILGGKGPAINVANGLFLSGALLLNRMQGPEMTKHVAQEISTDFYNTILVMTSGQHRDLKSRRLTADQWEQIAEAKSGEFFSLACRSGARLAVNDQRTIKSYGDYGFHLGVMLQIHDDYEHLKVFLEAGESSPPPDLNKSLAAAYASDMLPESESMMLQDWLESALDDPEHIDEILTILDESGAGLYIATQMERRYELARTSLEAVNPLSPAREDLYELLDQLKLVYNS